MFRTTIELDSKLHHQLKVLSVKEHKPFKKIVAELIRWGLSGRALQKTKKSSMKHWQKSRGRVAEGVDLSDRSTYWHLLERKLP